MNYATQCGNCKYYDAEHGVCDKHDKNQNHGDLCTGWEGCFEEETGLVQPKCEMLEAIEQQCEIMSNTLKSKNTDYGNSFEHTLNKYGDTALMLRLEDKFNRLESLYNNKENLVKDEGFEDTLRDLAGYCLLYLSVKNKGVNNEQTTD